MITDHHKVLVALEAATRPHGELCVGFIILSGEIQIQFEEKMDIRRIRRVVRHLARKGLAEYHKGLWTEDGEPAGAGYCITKEGIAALDQEGL